MDHKILPGINTPLGWTVVRRTSAPPTTAQTNYRQCPRTDVFDRDLYQKVSHSIELDTTRVNDEVDSYSQEFLLEDSKIDHKTFYWPLRNRTAMERRQTTEQSDS